MKKLIFVDNDDNQRSKKDVEIFVTPSLMAYAGLDEEYSTNIEIISDLYKKEKNELYDIFFSGKNAIITWSVYTATSFSNSKSQLFHFLRVAGNSNVKNIVYIDMSGMIKDMLIRSFIGDSINFTFHILKGIETNYIITLIDGRFCRIRLDLTTDNNFVSLPINLAELLS